MIPIIVNIVILVLQLISYVIVIPKMKCEMFQYYTQLSNFCGAFAAAVFLICGRTSLFAMASRYLATCMLTLTFLVVLTILIPSGENVKEILFTGDSFLYHILTPVLSFVSYCFFEEHVPMECILIPLIVTVVYGVIMIILNAKGRIDGPYPFLRVRHQSLTASVVWSVALLGVVVLIGYLLMIIG